MMGSKITKTFFLILFLAGFIQIKATDYYLRTSGGSPHITTNWTQDPTGVTATLAPTNFGGAHIWHIQNVSSVSLSGNWAITDGTVAVGDGTNTISWTISGAAQVTSSVTINVNANATLNVNKNISLNLVTLDLNSTVVFGSSQSGSIPATDYGNLTISATNTLGAKTGGTFINGTLTLNSNLTLSNQILNLYGTVSGSGNFVGDNNGASIYALGSSSGTLNFASGSRSLTLFETSSSGVISLGTDLTIANTTPTSTCYFNLTNGVVNLNGRTLTIADNADAYFNGGGVIRGSSASAIDIRGAGPGLSTSLVMETGNSILKYLALNRSSSNFQLSSNLDITDSLSILDGIFDVNSNILTLRSTSALKARIGRVGGTISGDITVETFIAGSSTGWANLGTNGVDGQTVKSWDTYSASAGANGVPMTCSGCDYDENALGSYFVSVKDWSESLAQYNDLTSSASLTPGKGFWVYVGDGLTSTSDLKLVNTGPAVTGSVGVALTSLGTGTNRGFNLVSNPYASPVSWAKVRAASVTSTNISNAIYVWNADLNSGNGGYAEYVGGTSTPSGISGISDIIPAGQGFYVEAPLVASLLVFDESAKMTNNTGSNPLLKPASPSSIGKILRLKLTGSTSDWDETVFRIHDDATPVFDREWDARKILQSPGYLGYPGPYSHYTTISSKDALGEDYSIHSVPPLTQSVSIPVLVRGMATGNYTIAATEYADINDCIMIKDNLTNTTQDLKMGSYVFSLNDTTTAPRFELILCRDQSLETASVNEAIAANNTVLINQDAHGAYVKTAFEKDTKAVISAYNIMGQKLMDDITVHGTANTTYLPLDTHNQVVFINVLSNSGKTSKKILLH